MPLWLTMAIGVTALAGLIELWRLIRRARLFIVDDMHILATKAFQMLDNANDVAETLEGVAGDVAATTDGLKQRVKRGLVGWL